MLAGKDICLLFFVVSLFTVAKCGIRGLNPALAQYYTDQNGMFKCLDGTKAIPFSQVNDNYCDCLDGTDEPGTSACHNGIFYCRNKGHEPRLLPSTFVDDRVCDCCDGSDELSGCTFSCLAQSAAHKKQLSDDIAVLEQALQTKAKYASEIDMKLSSLKDRMSTIDDEISSQNALLTAAQDEVSKYEAEEEERRRLQVEQESIASEAQQASASSEVLPEEPVATPEDHPETDEERGRRIASQWTTDPEAASQPEKEETDEERGRRIASQWTDNPEAAGHLEEYPVDEAHAAGDHDYASHHHEPHVHEEEEEIMEDSLLTTARNNLENVRQRRDELMAEKAQLTALSQVTDFGPGHIFAAYASSCFEDRGTRWVYEACWFGTASQRESWSSSKTTVGRWKGFEDNYRVAVFDNGDPCPQVGARSFRVTMQCGMEERLYGGEEPSTCQYAAFFTTPLLCTEDMLHATRASLAEVERLEAEVLAEVEQERALSGQGQKPHEEL